MRFRPLCLLSLFPLIGATLSAEDRPRLDPEDHHVLLSEWTPAAWDRRLGPAFADLEPKARDTRPRHFQPSPKACPDLSFANRTNPFELGNKGCHPDDDYWSESGQVAYVPDNPDGVGLDRIQVYAYYNHVFALSPRLDYASGEPRPDPQIRDGNYKALLGGQQPRQPVAMVRNYGMLQNEALVVYRNGLLAVAGTQTSRADHERPYPGLLLPKGKVPTAIAVTAGTEFALITLWDPAANKGQVAVVALEGKYLPFHTFPHIAVPNQGCFSDLKLLGLIDLPMAMPTAIAASSNGWWNGPSQTNNKVLSQIDFADEETRKNLYQGDPGWSGIIATKGYAVVASREEDKVAVIDLTPLFSYVRESYLASKESFERTLKERGPGPGQFPRTFAENEKATPKVVWQGKVPRPTAVIAGLRIDRWSEDRYKAHVASEDGTIRVYDASLYMARYDWDKKDKWREMHAFKVGRNPVSLAFARYGETLPALGKRADGTPHITDPLNNMIYAACRGERAVIGFATDSSGKGHVFRRIEDQRLDDPVAVSVAGRGYIVSVADFRGKKIVSFRIGAIVDRKGTVYGAGEDGKADYEVGGVLDLPGSPFLINSANVN